MEVKLDGFSIRDYTSKMRSTNAFKCWPFRANNISREEIKSKLPPMTVPLRSNSDGGGGEEEETEEQRMKKQAMRRRSINEIFNLQEDKEDPPAPAPPPPPPQPSQFEKALNSVVSFTDEKARRRRSINEIFNLQEDKEDPPPPPPSQFEKALNSVVPFTEEELARSRTVMNFRLLKQRLHELRSKAELEKSDEENSNSAEEEEKSETVCSHCNVFKADTVTAMDTNVEECLEQLRREEERKMEEDEVTSRNRKPKAPKRRSLAEIMAAVPRIEAAGDSGLVREEDEVNGEEFQKSGCSSERSTNKKAAKKKKKKMIIKVGKRWFKLVPLNNMSKKVKKKKKMMKKKSLLNKEFTATKEDASKRKVQNLANSSEILKDTIGNKTITLDDFDSSAHEKELGLTILSKEKKDQAKCCDCMGNQQAIPPIQGDNSNGCDVRDDTEESDHDVQVQSSDMYVISSSEDHIIFPEKRNSFDESVVNLSSDVLASSFEKEQSSGSEGTASLEVNINDDDLTINMHKEDVSKRKVQNSVNSSEKLKDTTRNKFVTLDYFDASPNGKELDLTFLSEEKKDQVKNCDSVGMQQAVPPIQDDTSNCCDIQDDTEERDCDIHVSSSDTHIAIFSSEDHINCPEKRNSFDETVFNLSLDVLAFSVEKEQSSRSEGNVNLDANENDDDLAINMNKEQSSRSERTVNLEANINDDDLAINMHKEDASKHKVKNSANSSEKLKDTTRNKTVTLDDFDASAHENKLGLRILSEEKKEEVKDRDSGGKQEKAISPIQGILKNHKHNSGSISSGCDIQDDTKDSHCDVQVLSYGKYVRSSADDYVICPKMRNSFDESVFNLSSDVLASPLGNEQSSGSDEGTANMEENRNDDGFAINMHKGKGKKVCSIVENRQFSNALGQVSVQSFLNSCANQDQSKHLVEQSESLSKVPLCDNNLHRDKGYTTTLHFAPYAEVSRPLSAFQVVKSSGIHTQVCESESFSSSGKFTDHSKHPTIQSTPVNSNANARTHLKPPSSSERYDGTANLEANKNNDNLAINMHKRKEVFPIVKNTQVCESGIHTQMCESESFSSPGKFIDHYKHPTIRSAPVNSNANARTHLKPPSSSESDEGTANLETNKNNGNLAINMHKRKEVFPIVENKQFSNALGQIGAQSFLKPCANQEKSKHLAEKSESLPKVAFCDDNLYRFDKGKTATLHFAPYADVSRSVSQFQAGKISGIHAQLRESKTSSSIGKFIDHSKHPTIQSAVVNSNANTRTRLKPPSSYSTSHNKGNEISEFPSHVYGDNDNNGQALGGTVRSNVFSSDKSFTFSGWGKESVINNNMGQNVFCLPLNSHGELINFSSSRKVAMNQLESSHTLRGSFRGSPVNNIPHGMRHVVQKTLQDRAHPILQYPAKLDAAESHRRERADTYQHNSELNLMKNPFIEQNKCDQMSNHNRYGMNPPRQSSSLISQSSSQPAMKLVGQDVGSSKEKQQQIVEGDIWFDKESMKRYYSEDAARFNYLMGRCSKKIITQASNQTPGVQEQFVAKSNIPQGLSFQSQVLPNACNFSQANLSNGEVNERRKHYHVTNSAVGFPFSQSPPLMLGTTHQRLHGTSSSNSIPENTRGHNFTAPPSVNHSTGEVLYPSNSVISQSTGKAILCPTSIAQPPRVAVTPDITKPPSAINSMKRPAAEPVDLAKSNKLAHIGVQENSSCMIGLARETFPSANLQRNARALELGPRVDLTKSNKLANIGVQEDSSCMTGLAREIPSANLQHNTRVVELGSRVGVVMSGPVELSAKPVLKPSQNVVQDYSRPIHPSMPMAATNPELQTNWSKINKF